MAICIDTGSPLMQLTILTKLELELLVTATHNPNKTQTQNVVLKFAMLMSHDRCT